MNDTEKKKRIKEAQLSTQQIVKEVPEHERTQAVNLAKGIMQRFEQIQLKDRCLRVRMLDWLSDTLLAWSKKAHEMSVKIDSPCVIRLPETKEPQIVPIFKFMKRGK